MTPGDEWGLERFIRHCGVRYEFERVTAVSRDGYVDLQIIVLPKVLRGGGRGTRFMQEICKEADRRGVVIGTSPDSVDPTTKTRLIRWYERFGFVENLDDDLYRVTYVRMPRNPQ